MNLGDSYFVGFVSLLLGFHKSLDEDALTKEPVTVDLNGLVPVSPSRKAYMTVVFALEGDMRDCLDTLYEFGIGER